MSHQNFTFEIRFFGEIWKSRTKITRETLDCEQINNILVEKFTNDQYGSG